MINKYISLLFLAIFLVVPLQAQSPIGSWEALSTAENGDSLRHVVLFTEGYQVLSIYNAHTGAFLHTNGGTWSIEGDMMTEKVEFHSDLPENVGQEVTFQVVLTDNEFSIVGDSRKFKRIDDGSPGALEGAWLMAGRIKDGETQMRDTNRPRKTMKILSGTRFQWIAYNTETKEFMGTGGGNYTTLNGAYEERIEFFSKDNSKVGLLLPFHYELKNNQWHHSGLSSKGDPIYEIWVMRE